jgi:TadE-like protein
MIQPILSSLKRFLREENGTSTIEFLFAFPIIFTTFVATFEAGFFTMRYVMLDRALDMTVRELRLGIIAAPAMAKIKKSICDKGQLIGDCENALTIELTQVDVNTWVFPTGTIECRDRGTPPKPVVEPNLGTENQMMLIRACLAGNPMFPSAIVAASMTVSSVGDYYVTAVSAFVNEP